MPTTALHNQNVAYQIFLEIKKGLKPKALTRIQSQL